MKGILNKEYKLNDNSTLPIGTEVEMITGYCGVGDYYYVCEMPDGTQYNIGSDYITVTDYAPYTDWRTIRANAATAAMQSLIIVIGREQGFTAQEVAEKSVMIADALIEKLKKQKAMKIYISLPITGRDMEEVEASCIFAAGVIEKKGHTAVSPLEVSPNPDASYAEHMGKDITALLECDAVLFLDGWEYSEGCLLEQRAAELYHKTLYFNLNDIKEQSKTDINIIMTAEEFIQSKVINDNGYEQHSCEIVAKRHALTAIDMARNEAINSVWHDVDECIIKPGFILIEFQNKYELCYSIWRVKSTDIAAAWDKFMKENKAIRYAYIKDLLPINEDEK